MRSSRRRAASTASRRRCRPGMQPYAGDARAVRERHDEGARVGADDLRAGALGPDDVDAAVRDDADRRSAVSAALPCALHPRGQRGRRRLLAVRHDEPSLARLDTPQTDCDRRAAGDDATITIGPCVSECRPPEDRVGWRGAATRTGRFGGRARPRGALMRERGCGRRRFIDRAPVATSRLTMRSSQRSGCDRRRRGWRACGPRQECSTLCGVRCSMSPCSSGARTGTSDSGRKCRERRLDRMSSAKPPSIDRASTPLRAICRYVGHEPASPSPPPVSPACWAHPGHGQPAPQPVADAAARDRRAAAGRHHGHDGHGPRRRLGRSRRRRRRRRCSPSPGETFRARGWRTVSVDYHAGATAARRRDRRDARRARAADRRAAVHLRRVGRRAARARRRGQAPGRRLRHRLRAARRLRDLPGRGAGQPRRRPHDHRQPDGRRLGSDARGARGQRPDQARRIDPVATSCCCARPTTR